MTETTETTETTSDGLLMPGERVILKAKRSANIFDSSTVASVTLLLAALVLYSNSEMLGEPSGRGIWLAAVLVASPFIILFVRAALAYRLTELILTDARVIIRGRGAYALFVPEAALPLERVESVQVRQGLLGNYGTVVITGTGGIRFGLDYVAAPREFRNAVGARIEKRRRILRGLDDDL